MNASEPQLDRFDKREQKDEKLEFDEQKKESEGDDREKEKGMLTADQIEKKEVGILKSYLAGAD